MRYAIATAALLMLGACMSKTGQVVHFDLPAKDPARLGKFYGELYGWETEKWESESGKGDPYWMLDAPRGGMFQPGIDGGIYERPGEGPELGAVFYIWVDDVDAYLEKARSLGAEVVMEKMAIPEVGFVAYIKDPEGNVTGLFLYAPDEATEAWDAEQAAKQETTTPEG